MVNFCTNCGTKLGKDDNFCTNCGTKLADEDVFCMNCGTKVNQPKKRKKSLFGKVKQEIEILKDETINESEKEAKKVNEYNLELEEKNKRNNSKKVVKRKLSDEIMDEIYSDIPKISNKAKDIKPRTIIATVPELCKKYDFEHEMISISI